MNANNPIITKTLEVIEMALTTTGSIITHDYLVGDTAILRQRRSSTRRLRWARKRVRALLRYGSNRDGVTIQEVLDALACCGNPTQNDDPEGHQWQTYRCMNSCHNLLALAESAVPLAQTVEA